MTYFDNEMVEPGLHDTGEMGRLIADGRHIDTGTLKLKLTFRSSDVKYSKKQVPNPYREQLIELNPGMSSFFKLKNVSAPWLLKAKH